ncbi:hypothetical protein [Tenuibacillus multivorans]|uniref:DUF4190 domain-containing protein n=1 Tax=Tenuibacillus multivorans TaxID=237069 RepID=A0A1G9ZDV9_9BACI|nr:hypothetical protein [Tenuibacillus multivorans]GEL78294.1 hypothetical protein TMU01_25290 [Tenuibacillus multivorans]SDN18653.1 hypothetical protein SAMN05216498_1626 [Tenuibacillus multivorans]
MTDQENNSPNSYNDDQDYFNQQNNQKVYTNFNEYDARDTGDDTEFASETATLNPNELDRDKLKKEEKEAHYEQHVDAGWGWIALVVSLLSFFVWTLLFAVVGAVIGIYAKRRGADTLGNIAIGLAILAVAVRLFVFPIM